MNKNIKTKNEAKALYESATLACNCMKWISWQLTEGSSEKQLANKIKKWFKANGAEGLSFDPIVAFGSNGANPHHKPTDRKLTKRDVVVIDMGCVYKGYCSDITRTFLPLKPTAKQLQVYKLVLKANMKAIKLAKPGLKANELDKIARDVITKGRHGKYFIHTTGHGIGKVVHDGLRIGPKDDTVLKNGMFFTIEPGIYIPNMFGIRIEDTVCLVNNKIDVLTKDMPK